MSDDTTVAVLLPVLNRADVIRRAVDSVRAQTHQQFELVVLDGGSTDGTVETVERIDDDRIELIDVGDATVGAARNRGVARTDGEIVAFLDSDDVWDERKLERHVTTFERRSASVGAVYSAFRRDDGQSVQYVPDESLAPRAGDLAERLLERHLMTPSALTVRRRAFERVGGFDESLRALEDWDLCLRLAVDYEFAFLDEPLVDVYLQPDSMMRQDERMTTSYGQLLQKHAERFETRPAVYARHAFRVGHRAARLGRPAAARRWLRVAAAQSPRPAHLVSLAVAAAAPGLLDDWHGVVVWLERLRRRVTQGRAGRRSGPD